MATFRTNFWKLLSEKELQDGQRYTNISELAVSIGTSRVTLYKYADEALTSVDASVVQSFMEFFELGPEELYQFLVLELSPQLDAQDLSADGAGIKLPATA